jgi:hypothetical protein
MTTAQCEAIDMSAATIAVDDVMRFGFTPAEQRQIFHDNAAELLAPPKR